MPISDKPPGLIIRLVAALARGISSYWSGHTTSGQVWLTAGIIALIVDAALCYQYGVTQTTLHGIGFAVVALFFAKLPDGAYEEWIKGNKVSGAVLGVLCIPLGAVAYQSHIGYGAGVRMGDIKAAAIQDVNWEDGRDDVAKARRNAEFFEKRATDLDAEMNKLVAIKVKGKAGEDGWAVAVKPSSPDELDEMISAKQLSLENEAKRVRCADRCEARKNELAHLKALRAKAVEIKLNADQHAAALEGLSKAKNVSSKTQAGMSSVAMQTTANTQLFGVVRAAWTGEPLEQAMKTSEDSAKLANLLITAAGSLAFMLMAPIGFFMAGRNRIAGHVDSSHQLTTGFTRGRAPDAETAQAGNHRAVVIERTIDDTEFTRLIAQARRAT